MLFFFLRLESDGADCPDKPSGNKFRDVAFELAGRKPRQLYGPGPKIMAACLGLAREIGRAHV